jgi:hypothetical protein
MRDAPHLKISLGRAMVLDKGIRGFLYGVRDVSQFASNGGNKGACGGPII